MKDECYKSSASCVVLTLFGLNWPLQIYHGSIPDANAFLRNTKRH